MTQEILKQIRELDAAAERAGGYVLSPEEGRASERARREFSVMRQYSLKHKKPIREFTEADYHVMGIHRHRT